MNTYLVNWSNICRVDESIDNPSNSEAVLLQEQENICLNVQQKLEMSRKINRYLQNSQAKLWNATIFGIPRIPTDARRTSSQQDTNLFHSLQTSTIRSLRTFISGGH